MLPRIDGKILIALFLQCTYVLYLGKKSTYKEKFIEIII